MRGRKDPVKKNMDLLHKPRTFRNRKKDYTRTRHIPDHELDHPKHRPYKRPKYKDWMDDDDDE